jgi:hypothetical protein
MADNKYVESIPDFGFKKTGAFYSVMEPPGRPDLPFRPPGQEPARLPPPLPPKQDAVPRNFYIDRIDEGRAVLLDDKGMPTEVPAKPGWRESMMTDGSVPPHSEGDDIRKRLSAGDKGGNIYLDEIGNALPKVPLAPGSPGPPLPPPADAFIGQKKGGQKKKAAPKPPGT